MAFDGKIQDYAPAVEVDEVGAIILKARELLSDPAKWCQGAWNYQDKVCLSKAISICADGRGRDDRAEARHRVWLAIEKQTGEQHCIIAFNDAKSTTHADVLAVLDRAVRPTREGEGQ